MYAFEVESLTTGYENTRIIENLNVSIHTGKITTIIGPNGCGKSTLLKTIGRILKKECGEIFLQNENMNTMSTKEIAKKLALLVQSPAAPGQLKVHELISYGRYPHRKNVGRLTKEDNEKINWAMEVTNTLEFRNREIAALSGGNVSACGRRWLWRKRPIFYCRTNRLHTWIWHINWKCLKLFSILIEHLAVR